MNVTIEQSWKNELADVWNKDYFINLTNFVKEEYRTKQIFPPGRNIFAAFNTTPFNDVKVVILGQDPATSSRRCMTTLAHPFHSLATSPAGPSKAFCCSTPHSPW